MITRGHIAGTDPAHGHSFIHPGGKLGQRFSALGGKPYKAQKPQDCPVMTGEGAGKGTAGLLFPMRPAQRRTGNQRGQNKQRQEGEKQ